MAQVVTYVGALTKRGYACYPVNVALDEDGDKLLTFRDGRWAAGDYPTAPDAIRAHWDGFDGIAINTGRSGLVVVDFDVTKGKDGFTALEEAGISLPDTPVKARTPSGGEHWYYREPEGVPVQSDNNGKLAQGVDIRARGGIVIAPPTEVPGRGTYEYINPRAMVSVGELPEFPRDVAEVLQPRKAEMQTTDTRPVLTIEQRQRLHAVLERILRDLRAMEDGNRNATMRLRLIRLFGIAMTLGEDLEAVAELVREAYFESGGTAERELESFITWAMDHARYELPEDQTDEAFEAEVARRIRDERIKEEVRNRISPIQATKVTDDDILEFDPSLGDEDWIIPGLLPRGETVILFGPPNAGKSFAGIDLGAGMATGTEAWGHVVPEGRVMYLAGEGTRRLAVRRRAWEVFHQREAPADRLQLRKMRLLLASDESVAEHRELAKRFRADLVIVDTMMRATEGLVLENPGEASRAIAQLDRIREYNPRVTVLVLHHPPEMNPDKPSGAFPIRGNVDTLLKVVNDEGIRTMSITKAKEGDTSWRGTFELRDIGIKGTNLSSAVWVPSSPRSYGNGF